MQTRISGHTIRLKRARNLLIHASAGEALEGSGLFNILLTAANLQLVQVRERSLWRGSGTYVQHPRLGSTDCACAHSSGWRAWTALGGDSVPNSRPRGNVGGQNRVYFERHCFWKMTHELTERLAGIVASQYIDRCKSYLF